MKKKPKAQTPRRAGRPSALTDHIKSEILRRLALGDKPSDLRHEYGISPTTFRRNFSETAEKVRSVAKALVDVESEMETLPFSVQVSVRTLADYMKSAQTNLARAAALGSRVSATLSEKAVVLAENLGDDFSKDGEDLDSLRSIHALATTSNESSKIAVGLVQANKGKPEDDPGLSKEDLLKDIAAMLPN